MKRQKMMNACSWWWVSDYRWGDYWCEAGVCVELTGRTAEETKQWQIQQELLNGWETKLYAIKPTRQKYKLEASKTKTKATKPRSPVLFVELQINPLRTGPIKRRKEERCSQVDFKILLGLSSICEKSLDKQLMLFIQPESYKHFLTVLPFIV